MGLEPGPSSHGVNGLANPGWSSEQHRLLDALGYTLYRPVNATPGTEHAPDSSPRESTAPAPPPTSSAAAPRESRLLGNVRLAAGGDPAGVSLPALEQLRRDPAGKRALWPLLRRLRRERR